MKELLLMLENLSNDIDKFFSKFSSRKLTARQIQNRAKMRKWWRSFKNEGELMIPFITGIILLGLIAYMSISSNI